jgi:hypothetical protein
MKYLLTILLLTLGACGSKHSKTTVSYTNKWSQCAIYALSTPWQDYNVEYTDLTVTTNPVRTNIASVIFNGIKHESVSHLGFTNVIVEDKRFRFEMVSDILTVTITEVIYNSDGSVSEEIGNLLGLLNNAIPCSFKYE